MLALMMWPDALQEACGVCLGILTLHTLAVKPAWRPGTGSSKPRGASGKFQGDQGPRLLGGTVAGEVSETEI